MEPNCLIISPSETDMFDGECEVQWFRSLMSIRIFLPWQLKFNDVTRAAIIATVVHEFSHFEYSYPVAARDRDAEVNRYIDDGDYRRYDERRTWKRTRQLLREMGFWNAAVRKQCPSYL